MKFNTKNTLNKELTGKPTATINHEGGLAFEMDVKMKLVTETLASFVEGKFYTDKNISQQELTKTVREVLEIDPEFVLKLAVYARRNMHLRSIPLFLLNEYANSGANVYGARRYVPACIERADEITELLSLSMRTRLHDPEHRFRDKKTSMFILKGLSPIFNKFDAYQFAKYKGADNEVSMKDALLLAHPVPKDKEQQAIFDQIVNGTLAPPETWEVAISDKGSNKESWEAILPKMGYMAVLRNLNNFIKHRVNLELVISKLTDPIAIQKSKQYPFRFYSAYKTIKGSSYTSDIDQKYVQAILGGLEKAIAISAESVPKIPGKSLVLVDVSGSMSWQPVSKHSKITPAEIAGMFGAISSKICDDADVIVFASDFGKVRFEESQGILKRMELISRADVGGGTDAFKPMDHARNIKTKYDRIFLFSDMQCYDSKDRYNSFAKSFYGYQREVNHAYLYTVDLVGYGTAQVPQDNDKVLMLAGFSEKLFGFIPSFESDRLTLVHEIENYYV
ncbi:MAG: TROVE domain-containing protein [Candidatus Pacebacteria bacterium]|nr:TROVE domain-containing protein [Candidatus Paceibacterota bacterium]